MKSVEVGRLSTTDIKLTLLNDYSLQQGGRIIIICSDVFNANVQCFCQKKARMKGWLRIWLNVGISNKSGANSTSNQAATVTLYLKMMMC